MENCVGLGFADVLVNKNTNLQKLSMCSVAHEAVVFQGRFLPSRGFKPWTSAAVFRVVVIVFDTPLQVLSNTNAIVSA